MSIMKIVMFNSDHYATPQEAKSSGALYPIATSIENHNVDELMATVETVSTCVGLIQGEIVVCIDTGTGYVELNDKPNALSDLLNEFEEV